MVFCGESSTSEIAGSVKENVETTQTSVSSGTEQSQEVNKIQQPQNNNNPFSDPNYAECLINAFGEDRYKQLQNERPTQEEEQKVGECLGALQAHKDIWTEDRPSEEYCKENQSDPKCQGGQGGPQGHSGQEDRLLKSTVKKISQILNVKEAKEAHKDQVTRKSQQIQVDQHMMKTIRISTLILEIKIKGIV